MHAEVKQQEQLKGLVLQRLKAEVAGKVWRWVSILPSFPSEACLKVAHCSTTERISAAGENC